MKPRVDANGRIDWGNGKKSLAPIEVAQIKAKHAAFMQTLCLDYGISRATLHNIISRKREKKA